MSMMDNGAQHPRATPNAAQINGQVRRLSVSSVSSSSNEEAKGGLLRRGSSDICGSKNSGDLKKEKPGARAFSRNQSTVVDSKALRQSVSELVIEEKEEEIRNQNRKLPIYIRIPRSVVDNPFFVTITTFLTLYALTGDDFRLMFTNKPLDFFFNYMTVLCLIVFSTEISLSCLGKDDYLGGFFFWLDLISTITLVLDITVVNDFLFQSSEEDLDQMKNSKTARIGARAARVVRVLRLVRVLKLYKAVYEARQKAAKEKAKLENPDDWDDEDDDGGDQEINTSESNVGKKLSDLTTRKCVILILAMIGVTPMLSPETTGKEMYATAEGLGADLVEERFHAIEGDASVRWLYEYALLNYIYFNNWYTGTRGQPMYWLGVTGQDEDICESRAKLAQISPGALNKWEDDLSKSNEMRGLRSIPKFARHTISSPWQTHCRSVSGKFRVGNSLIGEEKDDVVTYAVTCPEDLRRVESKFVSASLLTSSRWVSCRFVFVFDKRPFVKEEALFSFLTTLFVCVLLCTATMIFSRDAQELVLKPVEMMMLKVHMIRVNPLIAAKLTDEAFKREEIEKARNKKKKSRTRRGAVWSRCGWNRGGGGAEKPKGNMETAILEKTIIKLGTLLALSFGSAGMNIISQNMQGQDSAGVDAMIPGQAVDCVICYVRMGDFSTITEVLQRRIMNFVNQVAEIIHGVADSYHGAPSRNNGDTFLVVWTVNMEERMLLEGYTDMAVASTALILVGIHRSSILAAYRTHPGLQNRVKNFRVSVSFGLHLGWAIEGALGTEYKIDATYVSPNVSIAENVEKAADLYQANVLFTEAVHFALSSGMQTKCRLIDQVKIRGSPFSMKLFTLDLNHMALDIEPAVDMKWNTRMRFRCRQFLENQKLQRTEGGDMVSLFEENSDLMKMREAYNEKFHEVFGMGYQNYSQGEWRTANRLLRRALALLNIPYFEDGPSLALLRYMQGYGFSAPEWWKGFHQLEDIPMPPVSSFTSNKHRSNGSLYGADVVGGMKSNFVESALQEIPDEEPAYLETKLRCK